MNTSGCLTVSATEQGGEARNQIRIERVQRNLRTVDRNVYGAEGHEEEDKRHSERWKRWDTAYDGIFQLKRVVAKRSDEPKRLAMMSKCDEVAEWFRDNELAEDDEWQPKIADLRTFCGV